MPYYTDQHGKQLFYEDMGNGETIVWIHPPGMGRKVFKQQHKLARQYRLIFPDLSGNGDSEVVSRAPDITFYAKEINQLLDHLSISQAVIAGYSCGGMIAQEFALSYPQRVKALILAGGFPKVNTSMLRMEFLVGMEWVERSPETLAKLLSHSHFQDPEIKRELNEHMAKSSPEAWYEFYNHALRYDCSQRVKKLKMPMLIVYGNKEFWINYHTVFYRDCPQALLVVIENAYHQVPATHWDIFNQTVVDFLQNKRIG